MFCLSAFQLPGCTKLIHESNPELYTNRQEKKNMISLITFIFYTLAISVVTCSSACTSKADVGTLDCVRVGSDYSHYQSAVCVKSSSSGLQCQYGTYCWASCVLVRYGRSKGHVPEDCRCDQNSINSRRKAKIGVSCFLPQGDSCDWYENCLEEMYPCENDDDRYALSYAKHFCEKYGNNFDNFSPKGKEWVKATRKCLQTALVPTLMQRNTPSCKNIKSTAFKSHVPCYARPSIEAPTYCELSYNDVWTIFKTIKGAIVSVFGESVRGFFLTNILCKTVPISLYVTVKTGIITDGTLEQAAKSMASDFAALMQWTKLDIRWFTHFSYIPVSYQDETTFGFSVTSSPGTNLFEVASHAYDAVKSGYIQTLQHSTEKSEVIRMKLCQGEPERCNRFLQAVLGKYK